MVDEEGYSQFLAVHRGQLEVTGIPVQFWKTLHDKLKNEVIFFQKVEQKQVVNINARGR